MGRLVDKVLTPERVTTVLKAWLTEQARRATTATNTLKHLEKALKAAEDGLNNLYDAIEKGVVMLDSTFQARINRLKDEREKILMEMTNARRDMPSPKRVSPKQIAYACEQMRKMLLDPAKGYGKQLLRLLVSEIRVKPGSLEMTGSSANLERAVGELNLGAGLQVPSLMHTWRARQESNLYQKLRKLLFYPLNYRRTVCRRGAGQSAWACPGGPAQAPASLRHGDAIVSCLRIRRCPGHPQPARNTRHPARPQPARAHIHHAAARANRYNLRLKPVRTITRIPT